jgi:hypothetical protein
LLLGLASGALALAGGTRAHGADTPETQDRDRTALVEQETIIGRE